MELYGNMRIPTRSPMKLILDTERSFMNKYIFNTTAEIKGKNSIKYWINPDIIPTGIKIYGNNITDALETFREYVNAKYAVTISENAIKNKQAMYVDVDGTAKQLGYVITGKTTIVNGVMLSINLWIEIITVVDTDFPEASSPTPKGQGERYKEEAREFIQVLQALVGNQDRLENLESYLSYHFDLWLRKYANTPEDITAELSGFAGVEL